MSVSLTTIGRYNLQPETWVIFDHDKKEIPNELKGRPFKVIKREDSSDYICRCFLMTIEGDRVEYCPKKGLLANEKLPLGYDVKVLDNKNFNKSLSKLLSKEQIEKIHENATNYLKELAQLERLGKGFDPNSSGKMLSGAEIGKKYGLTLNKD